MTRRPNGTQGFAFLDMARLDPGTVLFTVAGSSVTLGGLGTAAGVIGMGLSAVSSIQQGNTQKKVAEYNARLSEQEAKAARAAADVEEQKHRRQTASLLSSQRAAIGASGLDLEGSPLSFMEQTAADAELDALLIRNSGSVAEARARSQAAADRMQGAAAQTAGYYGAGASVLSGVSTLSRGYGKSGKTGYAGSNLGAAESVGGTAYSGVVYR